MLITLFLVMQSCIFSCNFWNIILYEDITVGGMEIKTCLFAIWYWSSTRIWTTLMRSMPFYLDFFLSHIKKNFKQFCNQANLKKLYIVVLPYLNSLIVLFRAFLWFCCWTTKKSKTKQNWKRNYKPLLNVKNIC
jgi:hypothetical protein